MNELKECQCPVRALIDVAEGFLRNPRHDISCTYDPDGCAPDTDFCTCKQALPKAIAGAELYLATRAESPLIGELVALSDKLIQIIDQSHDSPRQQRALRFCLTEISIIIERNKA